MEKPNDLYADCLAAGIETDHHESDLYVKDCPKARELLRKYDKPVATFTSKVDNEIWLEVPFIYTPFWDKVEELRKLKKST